MKMDKEGQGYLSKWLYEVLVRNRKRLVELIWDESTPQVPQS